MKNFWSHVINHDSLQVSDLCDWEQSCLQYVEGGGELVLCLGCLFVGILKLQHDDDDDGDDDGDDDDDFR